MTTRALIMNVTPPETEPTRVELQTRDIDGKFRQADERLLAWGTMTSFQLYRLQHALVIGPARVRVANDGMRDHLKVEIQRRDPSGRFEEDHVSGAVTIPPMHHAEFEILRGEQLQIHERAAWA